MKRSFMLLGALLASLSIIPTSALAASATPTIVNVQQPTRVQLAATLRHAPKVERDGVKATAATAYVHLTNCQAALQGANGDNDIAQFIRDHSPYGINHWSWDGSYRRSYTDIIAYIAFWRDGTYIGTAGGNCWGDDSNISDRIQGW
jgi:hypothetical protein